MRARFEQRVVADVIDELERLRFPKLIGDGVVTAVYPIRFDPRDEP